MRERLQFSLRSLLVLLLAAACFFGGIATQRRFANTEAGRLRAQLEIKEGMLLMYEANFRKLQELSSQREAEYAAEMQTLNDMLWE